MITAGQLVPSTSVSGAEVAHPATIPVPRGRIDGGAHGGGDLSDGVADLQGDDPLGGGAVGRELPDGLVASAVRGDRHAREELLALIRPPVLSYCRARLGLQESVRYSADDVAQEICAAVAGALPTYRLKGLSFRAFVYGIAAHKVTDAFRAAGRDRTEPMAELPDTPDAADDPEHRLLGAERAEHLRALLTHLTQHQQEVLVLRLAVGLSTEETAQAVQSTPGAVRLPSTAPCSGCGASSSRASRPPGCLRTEPGTTPRRMTSPRTPETAPPSRPPFAARPSPGSDVPDGAGRGEAGPAPHRTDRATSGPGATKPRPPRNPDGTGPGRTPRHRTTQRNRAGELGNSSVRGWRSSGS